MHTQDPSGTPPAKSLLSAKATGKSKLLDEVREAIRLRHYSIRTEHRVQVEAASRGFNSRGIL